VALLGRRKEEERNETDEGKQIENNNKNKIELKETSYDLIKVKNEINTYISYISSHFLQHPQHFLLFDYSSLPPQQISS
jgi:hypothetical protein